MQTQAEVYQTFTIRIAAYIHSYLTALLGILAKRSCFLRRRLRLYRDTGMEQTSRARDLTYRVIFDELPLLAKA